MITQHDLDATSRAQKDALILTLMSRQGAALGRTAELKAKVQQLTRPPRTPDNSFTPPSRVQKSD